MHQTEATTMMEHDPLLVDSGETSRPDAQPTTPDEAPPRPP
jgi:hypothetical protein